MTVTDHSLVWPYPNPYTLIINAQITINSNSNAVASGSTNAQWWYLGLQDAEVSGGTLYRNLNLN